MKLRGNSKTKWVTCVQCGSRWGRLSDGPRVQTTWAPKAAPDGEAPPAAPPRCPTCLAKGEERTMTLRQNRADGSRFWGCPKFPTCRSTVPFEEADERAPNARRRAPEPDRVAMDTDKEEDDF